MPASIDDHKFQRWFSSLDSASQEKLVNELVKAEWEQAKRARSAAPLISGSADPARLGAPASSSSSQDKASAARRLADAAAVFEEALEQPDFCEGEVSGWRRELGPLLDAEEVQRLLGLESHQAVGKLVEQRQLLALPTQQGHLLFPAFQFTSAGQPYPVLSAVLDLFAGAAVSPYTIASWFVTPKALLRKKSPARWLQFGRDPERVEEAARRGAARLAR